MSHSQGRDILSSKYVNIPCFSAVTNLIRIIYMLVNRRFLKKKENGSIIRGAH